MKNHLRIRALLQVLPVCLLAVESASFGDTYTADVSPTISDISSQCVATCLSQTRTTIGIGEPVICTIDPGTWSDTDCNTTTGLLENDTMGTVVWSRDGLGARSLSGSGNSRTLTAASLVGPATATVIVRVYDSQTKYDEYVQKSKSFTVLSPTGEVVVLDANLPPFPAWTPGDAKGVAARTRFMRTIQPVSVTFAYAQFSESPDSATETFPDGHHAWLAGAGSSFTVQCSNACYDTYTDFLRMVTKPYPTSYLWTYPGGYNNFSGILCYSIRFETDTGSWCAISNITSEVRFSGSAFTGQHFYNAVAGGAQGPFAY